MICDKFFNIFFSEKTKTNYVKKDTFFCYDCNDEIKEYAFVLRDKNIYSQDEMYCPYCINKNYSDRKNNVLISVGVTETLPKDSIKILPSHIRSKNCNISLEDVSNKNIRGETVTNRLVYAGKNTYKNVSVGLVNNKRINQLDNPINIFKGLDYLDELKNSVHILPLQTGGEPAGGLTSFSSRQLLNKNDTDKI